MKILKHLNIVKLLEVINMEETLLIVMEYLSGGNLFTYLEAKKRPEGGGGPRRIPPAGLGSAALPPAGRGAPGLEAELPAPRCQQQCQYLGLRP